MDLNKIKKVTIVSFVLVSSLSFLAGAVFQHNKSSIVKLFTNKHKLSGTGVVYQKDTEIFKYAFTGKKIQKQLLPPCRTVDDITKNVDSMFIPHNQYFESYDKININDVQSRDDIVKINYSLLNRRYSSYCYYKKSAKSEANNKTAVLIMPGTGTNQSTDIFYKNKDNYHGDILSVFEDNLDIYVYVKPNEDFLAIHDEKCKLDKNFYVNYCLILVDHILPTTSSTASHLLNTLSQDIQKLL